MYVVDTNVVSELRRHRPHGGVVAWLKSVPETQLHLSAATIGEIQIGIEITPESDHDRAEGLEKWLDEVVASWRVLPLDGATFRTYARLMHRRSQKLTGDALIAATALNHGCIVVTRDVHDFGTLGVTTLNPFEYK